MNKCYKKSIITYIDIMGFKRIVERQSPEEIYSLVDNFRHLSTSLAENDATKQKYMFFSDTIIRSRESDNWCDIQNGNCVLFSEILEIIRIIGRLMKNGILIRGALVIDDLFVNGNTFFGPGIIRAYTSEALAKYPRIVFDKNIIELFDRINDDGILYDPYDRYKKMVSNISRDNLVKVKKDVLSVLRKGYDGMYYIDYLKILFDEYEDEAFDFINCHFMLIIRGLENSKNDVNILEKYLWMKRYHNNFIDSINKKIGIKLSYIDDTLYS
jgi:hypothetical protein